MEIREYNFGKWEKHNVPVLAVKVDGEFWFGIRQWMS